MRGLLPRSLVARMTWLVGVMGVMSLVLHLLVMSLWAQQFSEVMSETLVGRVQLSRELLLRTPPADRAALAATLSAGSFRVAALVASEAPQEPLPLPPGDLLQRLRARAGAAFVVGVAPFDDVAKRGELRFDFAVDGRRWRVSYRAAPPTLAFLGTGVGWVALVALGVFLSLALGVLSITRPMSLLAQRLSAQGQALQPLTLPPRAGAEITTLVGSFNQLVAAVQSADRTKQQMLAGVSHDLRTPLARLRLRIETECDGQLADELTSDLRAVERIVSQFLAYVQGDSRPGLGEPDSLRALITQAVERYRSQGQFVYATMGTGDAELPDLAVQRLLNNLIDNALSHGLAPVIVELIWHGDSPPALASLTVWDCGRGLDAAGFEQAQQPFMRLGERDVGLGHCGLGLAIVAQIAQQLSATLQRRVDAKGRFGVALTWPAPVDAKA